MKDTRKNIIDTTINLFKEKGYEETSVASICKECQITKGTFYYYFANKDEIAYAYYESLMENSIPIMKDLILIRNYKEQLWKIEEYYIDNTILLTPKLLKAFLLSDIQQGLNFFSPFKSPISSEHRKQTSNLQQIIIKEGQAIGEIKPGDPKMMMHTFISALIGIALDWASNDGNFDEKKELRKIFDVIF